LAANTPVDTGEHVSSWTAGIGHPAANAHREAYIEGAGGYTADANARLTVAAARRVIATSKPGQPIYISNEAPAIKLLNNGSSRKEPAGFVERAIMVGRISLQRLKAGNHGR